MKRSKILIIASITILIMLQGCVGELMGIMCLFLPDSSHCYQNAAVQKADPYGCEKVKAPEGFAAGVNPPKDKCYLMIAQNTGDYGPCEFMEGGPGSYSKEECYTSIAADKIDPEGCKKMTGQAYEACKTQVGSKIDPSQVTELQKEIDELKYDLQLDPRDEEAKRKLTDLESKRSTLMEFLPESAKTQYWQEQKEEILGDVSDSDVKSEIAKDFIKYKKANPNADVAELVERLNEIKEEKEFIKRVDEQANELVDGLKSQINDYADEKKQEMIDNVKEQGWEWLKSKSGNKMQYYLDKLEDMKGKYDKASEQYKSLTEKYEKIKKAYDEIKAVNKKLDQFNKMLADGKIDKGQANVLKGAVLLGKGLEYATSYVPVFGSTASKITKETFDATIKLAKKRAQRSNSLTKCMEDPLNCDPDGISGY